MEAERQKARQRKLQRNLTKSLGKVHLSKSGMVNLLWVQR